MLISESLYLKELISSLKLQSGTTVLNVGSQTETYQYKQPYIRENIIDPLGDLGVKIINFDLYPGEGVDINGDIFNTNVFNKLKDHRFSVIFVFNVLEHIQDYKSFAKRLEDILYHGGYILVSVPYKYPLHYDPIDNLFRPNPTQVNALFPNCKMLRSNIITDFNYWHYLKSSPRKLVKTIIRLLFPFYKFTKWRKVMIPKLAWLNKKFEITCVLLFKDCE